MRAAAALAIALAAAEASAAAAPPCEDSVPVWADGRATGTVCARDAAARGLTIIDLGDDWTPSVMAAGPDGDAPAYRTTYRALAAERWADAGDDGAVAPTDRYLELFGVEPTLSVVQARLDDDARHACHAAIDPAALAGSGGRIVEEGRAAALARIARARDRRADLEGEVRRHRLADLDALAASDAWARRQLDRLHAEEGRLAAIRAAQAHLACDGLFATRAVDGAYTWQTSDAIERFQRGAMILPSGELDEDTRAALALDSRERDFRTALRVLRERVVAGTGLVEDGTAGDGEGTVLGRALEPEATWRARGAVPLDDAAPDLVSAATDAAARALGWTDPAAARAFLDAHGAGAEQPTTRVAVALPPPPAYHGAAMELSIEIDRGDVWHDAAPRWHDVAHRPALILYAADGDRRVPLARWPTTIGGWQDEQQGAIEKRYKESPVGPRVGRDLYVAPTWLPPDATPDRELVRSVGDRDQLDRWALGPSYRSAYGLVMLVLHAEVRERGVVTLEDEGVRVHGTGNPASLVGGASHGCHRLLGLYAVRLAGFLLAHRAYARRGPVATWYRRTVRWHGAFAAAIDTRGYLIELTPPVPVEVLSGRVHPSR